MLLLDHRNGEHRQIRKIGKMENIKTLKAEDLKSVKNVNYFDDKNDSKNDDKFKEFFKR